MRFYRTLLRLYPASFRYEYGEEMASLFARQRREATGFLGAIELWISTLAEVVCNAVAVHGDILRQDLRYTVRTFARSRTFALTAVLVIALGIGATTAAFSVTDWVLIRPLPFPKAERLVKLWERKPVYSRLELSPANYRDWKRMTTVFDGMGAFHGTSMNLVGRGDPERLEGTAVTVDVFSTLGVHAAIGRIFMAADDAPGSPSTVMLSYRLWQTVFGGDPDIVGRTVTLDDTPHLIIGVMPRDFYFPTRNSELWTARRFIEGEFQDRNDNFLQAVARLGPGVSLSTARAELAVVTAQLKQKFPKENEHTEATVIGLREELSEQSRMLLIALSGAAICVLLIACANLANLLLARAIARQQELAVRAAMGAGRERLVRQLATESLVLAVLGGMVGLAVATAAIPLLTQLVPTTLPIAETPSMDGRVILFAAVITAVTAFAFGMVPIVRSRGDGGLLALREHSRAGGGQKEGFRSALVVAEVVASIVLLVSAGLLMRAMWRVQATDPGFRTDGVLTLRTALPLPKYAKTARREQFYTSVLSSVRALPGVSHAAYISFLPMAMRGGIWPVSVGGEPADRSSSHVASLRYVTPGFFDSLGITVHRGRDLSESDTADRPFVAVVSESFARQYWPNQDPLARHFDFAFHDRVIVGVVGDVRVSGLERNSEPQVYLSYKQVPDGWIQFYVPKDLVVRASTGPAGLLPAIRQIVASADPELPISNVRTMAEIVDGETVSRAAQLRVLGAFAALAILLAALGIHGVLAFAVSQRTHEIGIRIALGAQAGDILTMVVRRAVLLAAAGIVPGIGLAYVSGRLLESLLAGIQPGDAVTFLTAGGVAIVMTLAGSLLPTLRAIRVDPLTAIRVE